MASLTTTGAETRLAGRPETTLDKLCDWIETQVAPSLVVYEVIKGRRDNYDDVRRNLRKIGLQNAKPRHKAMISTSAAWLSEHDEPRWLRVKDEGTNLCELNRRLSLPLPGLAS